MAESAAPPLPVLGNAAKLLPVVCCNVRQNSLDLRRQGIIYLFCRSEIVKIRCRLPKINIDGTLITGIECPDPAGGVGVVVRLEPILLNGVMTSLTLAHSVKIKNLNQIW